MKLTAEQEAIVAKSRENAPFAVKAFAGTGKTLTAVKIAEANPHLRYLYLGFNRRVADEARSRFPKNTLVKTAHSLAFGAVGKNYKERITTSTYQLKMGLAERFERAYLEGGGDPNTTQLAFYGALEALNGFFASDDRALEGKHIAQGPYESDLLLRLTRGMWSAMKSLTDTAPVTHDFYLKLWQTGAPRIAADAILFDECQDASPAMLDIVLRSGIPTIFVGDPWQSIYAFRGAVDAFKRIGHLPQLSLSASWRFGPAVADQANQILGALGERQPLRGLGDPTTVTTQPHPLPDAVVARTTQGLVGEALMAAQQQRSLHVVGGTEQIFEWLLAVTDLMEYGKSRHRQFASMFKDYAELRDVSEMPIGAAFRPYVGLVDNYGGGTRQLVFDLEKAQTDPEQADVLLSSAHRFKGQEANVVRLAGDFQPFATIETDDRTGKEYVTIDYQEANLAYVALTRARKVLDLSNYNPTLRASLEALELHKELTAA